MGLVGNLGATLVCAGCLFAPSASELERAGTRVSSQAIDKAAQATQDQLAALRAEERLRQTTDAYEAAMKSASESLVMLARSANDLVVVLRDAPTSVTQAVTAQEHVQGAMRNIAELTVSIDRAIGVAQENVTVMRTAFADFRADLASDDGALNRQRMAMAADLRREREALVLTIQQERDAILGAIREERAVVLSQTDAISQRLADHVMNRLTELADLTAPRLIDQAARSIRDVARTALWLGALLLLLVFGLPFAAGLVLGKFIQARRRA
jgi:hypothetical protein